ncbi:ABC transporter permease [Bacillota bacterium Meth-B3]|nr:iron ABC transporter permease [Christensenellaceae bacterium]
MTAKSARLDRKKLWGDPILMLTILLVLLFLVMFILYPLGTVLTQSISRSEIPYMQELSDAGKLLTDGADGVEALAEHPVTLLGRRALDYHREYNVRRKTAGPEIEAIRNELNRLIAEVGANPAVVAAYARQNANKLSEFDAMGAIQTVADTVPELGKFALSFDAYMSLFASQSFMHVVKNTLVLGALSGLLSTAIGFLFAYVHMYTRTRLNPMFQVISVLPIVAPPFVLSLSAIMLFGKSGMITKGLLGIRGANIYGLHGVLLVQTLTFFPVCYLMLKGLLLNIDPSIEESARNMGASRWKVFTTVTLPLLLPGLGNAFLVTFIESVADFTNPMMIGGDYSTLASYIYAQVMSNYDMRSSAAMAGVMLTITVILFIMEKYWLERKSVATLSGKASRARVPIDDKSVVVPLNALCLIVSVMVIGMYALVPIGAFFKQWGRDFTPVLTHFQYVLDRGLQPFGDSMRMSLIAAPLTALLSMVIAYLVVKRRFWGRGLIEFVTMFAMAVPGTVLGIALLRGYVTGIGGGGFMVLVGTSAIIIIAFIVRSLPIGTRSGIAALRQIDKSIEESAYDMGAGSGKVFTSITLPLIKDSFFSGLVTTFARSVTATSAVIFLISARHQLITPQIMTVVDRGRFSVACAYATLMIVMVYGSIAVMNLLMRFFGVSRRRKEVI